MTAGNIDFKHSALANTGPDFNTTAEGINNDAVDQMEAEATASQFRLGGEKWIVNFLQVLRWDPGSVVCDQQFDLIID